MDGARLAFGLLLPWLLGYSVLLALDWPRAESGETGHGDGRAALRLGYGCVIGALLLTLWMRALSAAGMHFGWATIGAPLFAIAAVLLARAWRLGWRPPLRARRSGEMLLHSLPRWQQLAVVSLLAWLALRFASLAIDVAWRPLYPWNAWIEWATKARVWYDLGHIVPFVSADTWLAGATPAYFDAAPSNPATVPLLQVWSCIALGRWDDSAMNWPWLLILFALALSVYGALRDGGSGPLGSLLGVYLVVSLPLLDVQVALAGYPDLMMATAYALAALALYRWSLRRDWRDACIAAILALFCALIETSGTLWAITLLPGIVAALFPGRGIKLLGLALGAGMIALLALGRWDTAILGRRLGLDFEPSWRSLVDSYFLLGNWHLLWYGAIALAFLGARHLVRPPLAALAMIAAAGIAFLFVVFAYPGVGAWIGDSKQVGRAALTVAPLIVCLGILLWNQLTAAEPVPTPALAATSGAAAPTTFDA